MKRQLAFYFDSSFCSGCKTCQVACRDKNDQGRGLLWRKVYEVAGGDWKRDGQAWVQDIFSYYISMACNHCMEPLCLKSCPNGAIVKDGRGIVLINPGRCMGCRYCEWTCPYGALHYDHRQGVMTKCNMCADYADLGKPPACVSACLMRVLDAGDYELMKEKFAGCGTPQPRLTDGEGSPDGPAGTPPKLRAGRNDPCQKVFPLPDPGITSPSLVINPHPQSAGAAGRNPVINNREEVTGDK